MLNLFDKELKTCDCKNMDIKKKSIVVKLSKTKSKNGFILYRLKNGRFQWKKPSIYKPHWQTDCIV